MKALIGCLCVVIWGVVCAESLVWNKIIDLPASGVARPFAGVSDGRVLLAGGTDFHGKSLAEGGTKSCHDEIWSYDPLTSNWRLCGRLPVPWGEGASATTPGGLVCVGGSVGTDCGSLTNGCVLLKRTGRGFSATDLQPFPVAANYMAAAACGSAVYAVGGNVVAVLNLEAASPRWKVLPELPETLMQPVCAIVRNAICVFGETAEDKSVGWTLDLDAGDSAKWVSVPVPAQSDKSFADLLFTGAVAATDSSGRILLVGGTNRAPKREAEGRDRSWYLAHPDEWFRFTKSVLAFDPAAKRWSAVGELPFVGRAGAGVTTLPDGRLFVCGGEVGAGTRTASGAVTVLAKCDYPIRNADLRKVSVSRGFWFDRLETNRTATLRSVWDKCNETPRIANFKNAARHAIGTFGGLRYDDSDVFKMMEGTANILANRPDPTLAATMTDLIGEISRAQEPDGYLYTVRTLGYDMLNVNNPKSWPVRDRMGLTRWSRLEQSHELYNVGHMYEAAVAWQRATGRTDFLRIAEKSASLIGRTFGPDEFQLKGVPGHSEIELALCKLYQATGKRRYLDLARHFIDQKGHFGHDEISQNHRPFVAQREAVGHAVRAAYLYCGAVDVATLADKESYEPAIAAIWRDVVGRKLHLTGGIGATPKGEAFRGAYELPNDYGETYLETCAAIGNALWNDRMFRRSGEAKYADVVERVIYNGFLSGISLSGDEYFYPNPLASKGGYKRSKWFGTSCCPVNAIRFLPQIPSLAFAAKDDTIYWNQFMPGTAEINGFRFAIETDYPWRGELKLTVVEVTRCDRSPRPTELKIRIPGWAKGAPVPSDLYTQTDPSTLFDVVVEVNGAALNGCPGEDGYVSIGREWKKGDVVRVAIPMPVKRIRAHAKVEADRGRLAVERGPIVYCAEGADNDGKAYAAALPEDATFEESTFVIGDKTYPALKASNGLKLIPYCLWNNRKPGNDMQVWFKEK